MYIIAGLGNPGKEYEGTRHNVGFRALNKLAEANRITNFRREKNGLTARMVKDGESFLLVEPLTYMNLSGQCIGELSRYYKVPPEKIIVLYDDIDLEVGNIRVRDGGKTGSHNGIKSIASHLGSQAFGRIRIGVGRQGEHDLADYVLSRFPKEEEAEIEKVAGLAGMAALDYALLGPRETMNRYNGLFKKKKKEEASKARAVDEALDDQPTAPL